MNDGMFENPDNLEEFERKDTVKKLPLGWVVLFIALILWGIYYFIAYMPVVSGWSQYDKIEQATMNKGMK